MSPESTLQNFASPAIIVPSIQLCKCKSENGLPPVPEEQAAEPLPSGQWQKVSFDLSAPIGSETLNVIPMKQPGVVDINAVALRRAFDGTILWSATGPKELQVLILSGSLTVVPSPQDQTFLRCASSGTDPRFSLPHLTGHQFDQPLSLEIWIRILVTPAELLLLLEAAHHQPTLLPDPSTIQHVHLLTQERDSIQRLNKKLQSDLYITKTELRSQLEQAKAARAEAKSLNMQLERLVHEKAESSPTFVESDGALKLEHQQLRRTLESVLNSRSWRVTAPLRRFFERTRSERH